MLKVAIWTLGVVGKSAAPAIHAHPDMKLVGCYTRSPDKRGQDVGELCGTAPMGIQTTGDKEALLALKPDCVNPGFANVLALVATAACAEVSRVSVLESVDATNYESPGTWEAMGIGRELGDPALPQFPHRAEPESGGGRGGGRAGCPHGC